ncbi:T9SS type A sorting domain-containing protein [uncultured Algibacter sp.]|uniref:T9SS type A sorting domain-containing protein n=1 Tax=uncultured Algibacter sp. TaxID=298659 RepID=UPI003217E7D3
MKKIYFSLLTALIYCSAINAQTTIFDSRFDEASYDDAAVQANLIDHPDWLAGHNNGTATWTANTNNQILTPQNFAYSILDNFPITAVDGDVITITSVIMLGFDDQNFDANDTNMMIVALTPGLPPVGVPMGSQILGQQRDGVIIQAQASTTSVDLSNAGGTGNFTPSNPSLSQANKAAYEVIMEFTIGADAASSSKTVRIRNTGSVPETSILATSGGIRPQIYTALTGSGAYYFNWSLNFFQAGNEINRIVNNRLLITKNTPLLSTTERNAFEFGMYPNPVKNQLNINTKEPLQKIEILDLLGKSVMSINDVSNTIDVSTLNKSLYVIRLTSEKGVSIKKFIKE